MAGPNHSNAYATVTPIKQNMADLVTNIENQQFKYRTEKRLEDDIAEKQRIQEEEKQEKLRDRILKNPTINSTGVQSLDELQGRVLRQAIDRKYEIYQKLAKGGLSIEEQTALEVENKNIDNLPENLKLASDNYQNWYKNYDDQLAKGSVWREDKIDKIRKSGFDGIAVTLDERGLPLIGLVDRNGDGKVDKLDAVMNWENLKDGVIMGNLMPKFDYYKQIDMGSKVLGTEEITDQNGYTTTTTKQVPLKNIEQYVDGLMFKDGIASDFLLSRAREKGIGFNSSELTKQELSSLRDEMIQDIMSRVDFIKNEKVDLAAQDRDAKRNQDERFHQDKMGLEKDKLNVEKGKAKAKGETVPEAGESTKPSINVWGKQFYSNIGKNYRSVPINGKVTLRSIPTNKKDDNGEQLFITNPTLENYTYNKNGRLLLDVSFIKTPENKSTGQAEVRKKHQFVASDETEATVANQLGMTVEELRKKAQGSNEAAAFGL